jgi:methionyl-tRNA formyltransferase
MRIVFMGSPQFAVPSLNALIEAGHEVVCVYTQPPRPAGRGKGEQKTAVHSRTEELGIEVRSPRTLRDPEEQARFAALSADLGVVAAYGLILPKPILDAPRLGCINVHASLLPRWRGAAPIQRAILAGDDVTGVTIMQMEEGLDTGPMLLKRDTKVDRKTGGELTEELAKLGAEALVEWLEHPTPPVPQPHEGVTYAHKIDKAEARIDFTAGAVQVERQVRAFNPTPGAFFEYNGERIRVLIARLQSYSPQDPSFEFPAEAGVVLDNQLAIGCGTGAIRPLMVQRAGRGVMTTDELLRGFPIPKGAILR